MKDKYKSCLVVWVVELIVAIVLDKANIQLQSIWANAVGVLVFLLPLIVLFMLMSKDRGFSNRKRAVFRLAYILLVFCYVAGLLAEMVL